MLHYQKNVIKKKQCKQNRNPADPPPPPNTLQIQDKYSIKQKISGLVASVSVSVFVYVKESLWP